MKRVTFRAEEHLLEQARRVARSQHTTLHQAFREWLSRYAALERNSQEFEILMRRLRHIRAGGSFTREEMTER